MKTKTSRTRDELVGTKKIIFKVQNLPAIYPTALVVPHVWANTTGILLQRIELHFQRLITLENLKIMAPRQFVRHRLTFWERQVKFSHV